MSGLNFGSSGSSPFGQNPSGSGAGGGGGGAPLFGNIGASQGTTGSTTPSITGTSAGGQQASAFNLGSGGGGGTFGFNKPNQGSSTGGLFGGTSTPSKPAEPASSGPGKPASLFGSMTPATSGGGGLFGQTSTTPAGPPPGGLGAGVFGGQAANKPEGTAAAATTATTTTPGTTTAPQNLFGNLGQQQQQQQQQPQQPQQGSLLGGSISAAPSTGGLFNLGQDKGATFGPSGTGTAKSDEKPPSFGGTGSMAAPQASNPFGSTAQSSQKPLSFTPTTSTSGGSSATAATTADSSWKSLFPTASEPSKSQTPSTAATTSSPLAGGLFGQPKTTTAAPDSTTPAPSGGNLLAGIGKSITTTTDSTAAPASSAGGDIFANIGKPAATDTTTTPASTGGFSMGKPATTTATSSAPAGTSAATPTSTATAGATATTTTTSDTKTATAGPAAGGVGLGASTVGPVAPAQSRLKNKTMDEIITRWATDLTKYQKEFQEQAEQVAEWDRLLVENTGKVQKLYGNTVDAERATQEVERQLSSVEGQQDELSSWLDRYEQEVDALLSKQVGLGDTLQGPDQERERTYKLAERLSERLNEVGQDLTSMVEEVNAVSSSLSKTSKADEPISQIVRILNSHLSQLQLIDQGTANLRTKLSETQKAGNSLSSQYGGSRNGAGRGASGSAAEDFYRAYMGRR